MIELGPGAGALTRLLHERYPLMTAVELDERAISLLSRNIPDLDIIHDDVLQVRTHTGSLSVCLCVSLLVWRVCVCVCVCR